MYWTQVVNDLHWKTNCLEEHKFNSWVEQFLSSEILKHV